MKSYFLWPEHKTQYVKHFFGASICAADIEATLETFFPDAVPVLFSSARAGLSASLQLLKISRPDDDVLVLEIVAFIRGKGFEAFLLPQPIDLPFGGSREDILVEAHS